MITGQNSVLNQYTPTFLIGNITNGQTLKYDSTKKAFVNTTTSTDIDKLGQLTNVADSVDVPSLLSNSQSLIYDSSSNLWKNSFIDYNTILNTPSIPTNSSFSFSNLSDTAKPPLPNGYVQWNSTGTQLVYSTTIPASSITGLSNGSVTSVSVTTANGISGTVLNPTTTPAISLTLGNITPGNVTASGIVSGTNLTGINTGDQTITLTGDVSGSGTGTFGTVLANTGVVASTYGSTTEIPVLSVDSKGRITSASTASITLGGTTTIGTTSIPLNGTSTSLAGLLSVTSTTFTGNLTGNASTATTATSVSGIIPGANGGTGVANTGKTITIGGNLSTVGAYTTRFDLTGNTQVTLPVSGNLISSVTGIPVVSGTPSSTTYLRGDGSWAVPEGTGGGFPITLGSTSIGANSTTNSLAGLSSVTSTSFVGNLTGSASANILKTGDTMSGYLLLNADPVSALGAATKQYVDNMAAGLNAHLACETSSTGPLPTCVYSNGSSGVGATLTASVNGTLTTIGGYTGFNAQSRILIKDQVDPVQNGIYVVTDKGSVSTKWVLTRATDFDNNPSGEVSAGDFTYIQNGTLTGTQWVMTTVGTITIGTTGLVFTQLSGAADLTAGTGIDITGNVVSNTGVLSITAGSNISASGSTGNITLSVTGTVPSATTASTATTATNVTVADDTTNVGTVYPMWTEATSGNTPPRVSSSRLSFHPSTGALTAVTFVGNLSGNATNAGNTSITDDISTSTTVYPTWVTSTSGNLPQKTSSSKLTFQPSTGTLTATNFVGNFSGSITQATNLAGGLIGYIPYQSAVNTTTFLVPGTSGYVLTSNGTGAAPTWQLPTSGSSAANTLTGTTLASNVVNSSLTSVGTLTSLTVNNTIQAPAVTGSTPGIELKLVGGASAAGTGGRVFLLGGAASTTGQGGAVDIYGGAGRAGGSITIQAGQTTGTTGAPGNVTITGGAQLNAGAANTPGFASLNGGNTVVAGQTAGPAYVTGGQSIDSTGTGGSVYIYGGLGGSSGVGGAIIHSTAPSSTLVERFRILSNGAWSVGTNGTSTGTSGQVLASTGSSTAPIWTTTPTLTLSASTIDGVDAPGFRNIPQNSQSTNYTLVLADSGKHIFHPSADTTARTWTIPSNAAVPYPIGTALTFINQNAAGIITIAINSDIMRLAGAGTTGSRTLAANGCCTAIKITATEWIISGTNLT